MHRQLMQMAGVMLLLMVAVSACYGQHGQPREKLEIGDHSWIGEDVWIDNLDQVSIGDHCCISQGAYLCTGSHRWDLDTFDLQTGPIVIADRCWVGAMTKIAPNARMAEGAVATMDSVVIGALPAWTVCSGNPAQPRKARRRAKTDIPQGAD